MNKFSYLDWQDNEDDRRALVTMIELNEYIKENIIIEEDLIVKLNIDLIELENLREGKEKVNINTLSKIENFYNRKFFMIINENLRNYNLYSLDIMLNLGKSNLKKIGETYSELSTKNSFILSKKKPKNAIELIINKEYRVN